MRKLTTLHEIIKKTYKDNQNVYNTVATLFSAIGQELAAGEHVYIPGFGTFYPKEYKVQVNSGLIPNCKSDPIVYNRVLFKPTVKFKKSINIHKEGIK
jgi:nucleoid DNA-binding protein